VASIVIQRKWRATLVKAFLVALCRVTYKQVWDPVSGKHKYEHKHTKELSSEPPILLHGHPFDPNDIPNWKMERVVLFIRRIGLKQYAERFEEYGVNGNALLQLDMEDYHNMEIFNKVHITKIKVEMTRIFNPKNSKLVMNHEIEARREKIRKAKLFKYAAQFIQRVYRGYQARLNVWNTKEVRRINIIELQREKDLESSQLWWMERLEQDVRGPSRAVTPPTRLLFSLCVCAPPYIPFYFPTVAFNPPRLLHQLSIL
jgi:hypothetical protein